MFNKVSWFLSTFSFYIISAIIVAFILINMFTPNKYPSIEEIKKKAECMERIERSKNELSEICISEGHIRSEDKANCELKKYSILLGEC